MEGKRFDKVFNGLKYALVRLTSELKLTDCNCAARELILLPRRNASVKGVLKEKGAELSKLGSKFGSAQTVVFVSGGKHINAVAMRERDGGILCFVHPLLTAVSGVRLSAALSRLASFYAKNILLILEEAESSGKRFNYRIAAMSSNACYKELSENKYYTLMSVFNALVGKLAGLDLHAELAVVFDDIRSVWSEAVNSAVVMFAVSELINVFEIYGAGERAVLHIGYSSRHMHVILRDKLNNAMSESDGYFLRIFSEMMKMIGTGCEIKVLDNGRFNIKFFIPTDHRFYKLKAPPPQMEDSDFAYYNYCLDNYLKVDRTK